MNVYNIVVSLPLLGHLQILAPTKYFWQQICISIHKSVLTNDKRTLDLRIFDKKCAIIL